MYGAYEHDESPLQCTGWAQKFCCFLRKCAKICACSVRCEYDRCSITQEYKIFLTIIKYSNLSDTKLKPWKNKYVE